MHLLTHHLRDTRSALLCMMLVYDNPRGIQTRVLSNFIPMLSSELFIKCMHFMKTICEPLKSGDFSLTHNPRLHHTTSIIVKHFPMCPTHLSPSSSPTHHRLANIASSRIIDHPISQPSGIYFSWRLPAHISSSFPIFPRCACNCFMLPGYPMALASKRPCHCRRLIVIHCQPTSRRFKD